jgi:hypothetical protein
MTQQPEWTEDEFAILMHAGDLSAEELVLRLPRRSAGAIRAVRGGIHDYHATGSSSLLSRMQRDYLQRRRGTFACPLCRTTL